MTTNNTKPNNNTSAHDFLMEQLKKWQRQSPEGHIKDNQGNLMFK